MCFAVPLGRKGRVCDLTREEGGVGAGGREVRLIYMSPPGCSRHVHDTAPMIGDGAHKAKVVTRWNARVEVGRVKCKSMIVGTQTERVR